MKVVLIGTGNMAKEYLKVLRALNVETVVVGRSEDSILKFSRENNILVQNSLDEAIRLSPKPITHAINAVSIPSLTTVTENLLKLNIKNILIEKPAAQSPQEMLRFYQENINQLNTTYVAFNRRFLQSVIYAEKLLKEDGGIQNCSFEFTEWEDSVTSSKHDNLTLKNWAFANSSHVIDLAFYLIGLPKKLHAEVAGSLSWHPSGSTYSGSGISQDNCFFQYSALWNGVGRWGITLTSSKHKIILSPLEEIKIIGKKMKEVELIEDNYDIYFDKNFKPGFYLQVKNFLENNNQKLHSVPMYVTQFLPVLEKMTKESNDTL